MNLWSDSQELGTQIPTSQVVMFAPVHIPEKMYMSVTPEVKHAIIYLRLSMLSSGYFTYKWKNCIDKAGFQQIKKELLPLLHLCSVTVMAPLV